MFHSNLAQITEEYLLVSSHMAGIGFPFIDDRGISHISGYIRMPKTSPRSVGSRSGWFFLLSHGFPMKYFRPVFMKIFCVSWILIRLCGSWSQTGIPRMWPTPGCIDQKPSEIPWRYVINMVQSICTTWTNQHKWLVGGWKTPLSLITQNRSNRSNLRAASMRKHHLDRSICPICLSVRPWMTRT